MARKPMSRFVLLLPAETHKILEHGAKNLGVSKAFYARLMIDRGVCHTAPEVAK